MSNLNGALSGFRGGVAGFLGQTNNSAAGTAGGDLTGFYPNPTLTPLGAGGVVGDASNVGQITFDTKGRITSAVNVPIAAAPPSGAAGGVLAGTYPNPSLAVDRLPLSGGTMTGNLNMGVNRINALNNGLIASDAVNLSQIPTGLPPTGAAGGALAGTYPNPSLAVSYLPLFGGTMTGSINMAGLKITSVGNGTLATDAAAFGQIPVSLPPSGAAGGALTGTYPNPSLAVSFLPLSGGTMTGAIDMGAAKISNVGNGTLSTDVAAFGQIPTSLPPGGAAAGDLTGTYPAPELINVGSAATAVGSSTTAPVVTTDSKGRVTALTSAQISMANFVTFTASGSWTCPAGVVSVLVTACGGGAGGSGGGAGGGGSTTAGFGGGGGGRNGGNCALVSLVLTVVPGTVYAIGIGAGGAGGAGGIPAAASATGSVGGSGGISSGGGNTLFGSLAAWPGGQSVSGGSGGSASGGAAAAPGGYSTYAVAGPNPGAGGGPNAVGSTGTSLSRFLTGTTGALGTGGAAGGVGGGGGGGGSCPLAYFGLGTTGVAGAAGGAGGASGANGSPGNGGASVAGRGFGCGGLGGSGGGGGGLLAVTGSVGGAGGAGSSGNAGVMYIQY